MTEIPDPPPGSPEGTADELAEAWGDQSDETRHELADIEREEDEAAEDGA